MGWSAWIPMGSPPGGFAGRPAALSRNSEVANVYVRGADDTLWQLAYWDGRWHGWGRHGDGALLASAPTIGSMGPNHEIVFVTGTDGALWGKYWVQGVGWSGWGSLGAPDVGYVGDPVTICRNPLVCNVYVRGADNALWQQGFWDGFWHGWVRHNDGAVLTSAPAAASMGPDHEMVFAIGIDGQVWSKWWTAAAGWSGWVPLGAPDVGVTGGVCALSRDPSVVNVYVRGRDDSLWQRGYWGGFWHDWGRHPDGAVLTAEPAASSRGRNHEQVVHRGRDSQVYLKWWEPSLPTIDVNLIKVGVDHFAAADIGRMQDSVAITRWIYSQVGLNVGAVNHFQINSSQAGALEVVDSLAEAEELTDRWTVHNNALDVFVVRSMNGADGWSAINGSCDKDSAGMTGSVVSLNGSLPNSGNTFAHELGHYLGLSHIPDTDNFIGNNGSSNSNTVVYSWQGDTMKKHCFVIHV